MAIQTHLYSDNRGLHTGVLPDWIENGCGFNDLCFNLPQKQQFTQQQQQAMNLQNNNNSAVFPTTNVKCHQSNTIGSFLEKQKQEIDRFISLQNQRLRMVLQEQRKQELALLLRKYEANAQFLLKQRDEEMAKAFQRTMELEDFLRKMEFENQNWQRVARENEAMALSLNNSIEQIKQNACFANEIEDSESCCDVNMGENRGGHYYDDDHHDQKNEEQITRKMVCRSCNSRNSCVIFLPCRHICSCQACEPLLDSCPVCGMRKKAKIEALI